MPAEIVLEWVRKAEADWTVLELLRSDHPEGVADVAVFLAQQCAEKYLKSLIRHEGDLPPRTHNLAALLDQLLAAYPGLASLRSECNDLTDYAVTYRYPGERASAEQVQSAREGARRVREAVRLELGLAQVSDGQD